MLGLTTVRSRKRKVLSRKRKLGLDLFHSGIYLFPALQNIYSVPILRPKMQAKYIFLLLVSRFWKTPFSRYLFKNILDPSIHKYLHLEYRTSAMGSYLMALTLANFKIDWFRDTKSQKSRGSITMDCTSLKKLRFNP